MRIHLGLQSCCLLRLPRGLKHLGDVLVDLLPHALAVILLRLSIFLELLLSLLVTLLALLFSLLPLLVFLRPNLLLPGRLSFPVILDGLLLRLRGDDSFQVDHSLLQAVNLGTQRDELFVNVQGLLVLLLALQGVAEREISVHIVLTVLNTLLQVRNRGRILTANVVEDACVVQHNGIDRVQVDGALVVVEGVVELAGALHIDAHVLEDARLLGVVSGGILVLGQSFGAVTELLVDDAEIHLGLVVIRVKLQNLYMGGANC